MSKLKKSPIFEYYSNIGISEYSIILILFEYSNIIRISIGIEYSNTKVFVILKHLCNLTAQAFRHTHTIETHMVTHMHTHTPQTIAKGENVMLYFDLLTISRENKYASGITHFIYDEVIVTSSIVIRYHALRDRSLSIDSARLNMSAVVSVADEWRWQWGTTIAKNLNF